MTSDKQIEANRRNCQKSTGPSSGGGKAIVCQNAIKHGILSAKVSADPGELVEYTVFADNLTPILMPVDPLQSFLADRIISTAWRLRRIIHVEALMFEEMSQTAWGKTYREIFWGKSGQAMAVLSRYEKSLENSLYRALKQLSFIQNRNAIELPI